MSTRRDESAGTVAPRPAGAHRSYTFAGFVLQRVRAALAPNAVAPIPLVGTRRRPIVGGRQV